MSLYSRSSYRPLTRNRGVTLVELMIALVISMVVLLAVGSVYFNTKRTYAVQDEFARMQESALFAFQSLTQDVSTAGFGGCSTRIKNQLAGNGGVNAGLFNFTDGVFGWNYTGTDPGDAITINSFDPAPAGNAANWKDDGAKALDPSLAGKVLPDTDVVVIKSSRELSGMVPDTNVDANGTSIHFATPTLKSQGAVFLISDCAKGDLFMNSDGPGDQTLSRGTNCGGVLPCNAANPSWSHGYRKEDVRIYASTSRAYYIGKGVNGQPALFRYNYDQGAAGTAEELVDGVENMQVLYGVDTTAVPPDKPAAMPVQYVPIDKVVNLNSIVSVRISLLMRSTGELNRPLDPNTYLLAGTKAATAVSIDRANAVNDKRLRKVFTTTIAIRNMAVSGRQVVTN